MTYDDWKLATPPEYDDERDDDTGRYGTVYEGSRVSDRCVLGDECVCPHPFHGADECATAEMMSAYEADIGGEP